jgi:hypothetical protein
MILKKKSKHPYLIIFLSAVLIPSVLKDLSLLFAVLSARSTISYCFSVFIFSASAQREFFEEIPYQSGK